MDTSGGKPKESKASQSFADEEEIKILERRLQLLREGLHPLGGFDAKEAVKETRETQEGEAKGELPGFAPLPPDPAVLPGASAPADADFHDMKAKELSSYESDKQLNALVEIAFERNLKDAVDIARRLDDAYLLDAFHDALIDELHGKLVERGKLEEE